MRRVVPALILLGACKPNPEPGATWIAPLDGQTNVGQTTALRVHVDGLQIPPDYPVPADLVRVVDLAQDGFVPGLVTIDGPEIRFTPDEGWIAGHRYAWSIGEVPDMDRAPEFNLPASLYGEAVFGTSGDLDVLEITLEDGRVCALLSVHAAEVSTADVAVTVDDEPVEVASVDVRPEVDFTAAAVLDDDDAGVSVACFDDVVVPIGSSVRISWGDRGPWHAIVDQVPIAELIELRRRAR